MYKIGYSRRLLWKRVTPEMRCQVSCVHEKFEKGSGWRAFSLTERQPVVPHIVSAAEGHALRDMHAVPAGHHGGRDEIKRKARDIWAKHYGSCVMACNDSRHELGRQQQPIAADKTFWPFCELLVLLARNFE